MKTVRHDRSAALYTADSFFARRIGLCLPGFVRLRVFFAADIPDSNGDFPGFLLVDLSENPGEGLRLIGKYARRSRILCFLDRPDQNLTQTAILEGADGVLLKSDPDGRISERLARLDAVPGGTDRQTRPEPLLPRLPAILLLHSPAAVFHLIIGYLLDS